MDGQIGISQEIYGFYLTHTVLAEASTSTGCLTLLNTWQEQQLGKPGPLQSCCWQPTSQHQPAPALFSPSTAKEPSTADSSPGMQRQKYKEAMQVKEKRLEVGGQDFNLKAASSPFTQQPDKIHEPLTCYKFSPHTPLKLFFMVSSSIFLNKPNTHRK